MVHAARWRDLKVAVKSVVGHFVDAGIAMSSHSSGELDKEIAMLQQVRHANIVLFFGAGTSPDGAPFLVTELVELGTLADYLHTRTVDWKLKMVFAMDTARGMAHVHSLGRMHRDLKSGNLLVSSSLHVKVADFGTATIASMAAMEAPSQGKDDVRMSSRASTQRTRGVGTPLWMAPEIIEGNLAYGPSADMYSFGIVMWEIAAQAFPWNDIPETNFFMEKLLGLIKEGRRPVVDAAWLPEYRALMVRCWATEPEARPTFTEAYSSLESINAQIIKS